MLFQELTEWHQDTLPDKMALDQSIDLNHGTDPSDLRYLVSRSREECL